MMESSLIEMVKVGSPLLSVKVIPSSREVAFSYLVANDADFLLIFFTNYGDDGDWQWSLAGR